MVGTGFPSGRVADVWKKEARTCGGSSLCVLAQGNSVVVVNYPWVTEMTTTANNVLGTSDLQDLRCARTASVLFKGMKGQ